MAARVLGGRKELLLRYAIVESGRWRLDGDRLTMIVESWQPTAQTKESADYLPTGAQPMFADMTGRTHIFDVVHLGADSLELHGLSEPRGVVMKLHQDPAAE